MKQEKEYEIGMFHELLGLDSGTTYELEVRARNSVGWSPTAQQFIQTEGGMLESGAVPLCSCDLFELL